MIFHSTFYKMILFKNKDCILKSSSDIQPHLILIHPDMGQAQGIVGHCILATGWTVGSAFAEDMPHPGARYNQQLSPTHPDLKEKMGWELYLAN